MAVLTGMSIGHLPHQGLVGHPSNSHFEKLAVRPESVEGLYRLRLAGCRRKQARNFEAYLNNHRSHIVNYEDYQSEQLCSIGSGAVESAVKQIGRRL